MKKLNYLFFILVPLVGSSQPGTLDATFGTNGMVITAVGPASGNWNAVAIQPDGYILAVGEAKNAQNDDDYCLIRLDANGILDPGFGTNGIATNDLQGGDDTAFDMVLQPDGKIVVVGESVGTNPDLGLVRYNTDGSLDNSFGTGGIVLSDIGGLTNTGRELALQPDGKIVVCGWAWNSVESDYDISVQRFMSDGSVDMAFGTDGLIMIHSDNDYGFGIAIQPDGKIVVCGQTGSFSTPDVGVARLLADGTLDSSFGTNGWVEMDLQGSSEFTFGVALQPNGRILLAGTSYNGNKFLGYSIRLNSDGSMDTSWDSDGILLTDLGTDGNLIYQHIVQSDGKVLGFGYDNTANTISTALFRWNADGTPDTSFGTSGSTVTTIGSGDSEAMGAALQSDGKIVVASYADNGSDFDGAVLRYENDASIGIDETVHAIELFIYPNPTSDQVTLSGLGQEIWKHEVIDALGRVVLTLSSFGDHISIDVSELSKGHYTIKSSNEKERAVTPLVID